MQTDAAKKTPDSTAAALRRMSHMTPPAVVRVMQAAPAGAVDPEPRHPSSDEKGFSYLLSLPGLGREIRGGAPLVSEQLGRS